MMLSEHCIGRGWREVGTGLAALVLLALAGPALAGQRTGNLAVRLLELELGGPNRFVLCDDADGSRQCDPGEELGQQNVKDGASIGLKGKDACKLVLEVVAVEEHERELVGLAAEAGDPGLDANKGAIGDQDNRGTGCGQLEQNDHLDIHFLGLGVVESRLQFEAKQDVAAVISFKLNGAEVTDSEGQPIQRFLISGTADPNQLGFPATTDDNVLLCNFNTPDGNPDSAANDDCLLYLSRAHGDPAGDLNPEPLHDEVSIQIVNSGALSLKGGSEYEKPDENRTSWDVVEFDGALSCGDDFSCSEAGCSVDGVTGNRTREASGDACLSAIPFDLEFDGREISFEYLDPDHQNPGIHLESKWQSEPVRRAAPGVQVPIDPTILSYDPDGVSCDPGHCSNDGRDCQSNSGCDAGNTCVLTVSESCIPLATCVGTPIRSCSNDPTSACEEDRDCGDSCASGASCVEDADCTDMSACLPRATCRLTDLVPPGGTFPDLVDGVDTLEYGCVCEENVRYLGPGVCDAASGTLAGGSCEADADCGTGSCDLFRRCDAASGTLAGASCTDDTDCDDGTVAGSCDPGDEIAVEQCLFFTGDALFSRGGGGSRK